MKKTGDPPTLAPEICVEVLSPNNLSPNNRWANIEEKIGLYREAGPKDVWVVGADRQVRFFGDEEMEASALVPDAPTEL
mgnify:CR=1 FL=1